MKHYLLTWYGMTDLRAALGFERSDGPILSALKAGDFTHVIVLAYSDPRKKGGSPAGQIELDKMISGANGAAKDGAGEAQSKVLDALANTSEGHERFQKWLGGQIKSNGREILVQVCTKELKMLHDAKGIYDAAIEALDIVAAEQGEKRVTFYLSPGTPVMAFTWAFVALANPELDIQIISSSEPRKPPVSVQLPYELLAPSNRRVKRMSLIDEKGEFNAIFHLFGQQRLPALLGILQFSCNSQYFVTSEKYSAEPMRRFLPSGSKFSELRVNPFDPMSSKVEILKVISQMPAGARVGFNLTGGTKLMFAGAIAACRKIGGVPFYFETRDHNLIFLHDFTTLPMRGIDDVKSFFELNDFHISRAGKWLDDPLRQQRTHITRHLWEKRALISRLYKQLNDVMPREGERFQPFLLRVDSTFAELDRNGRAVLRVGGVEFILKNCPDFARYLCGGWLEEYVYLLLEPKLVSGTIKDLRIGLEVSWAPAQPNSSLMAAQEFDVCFTDGNRLTIIECKAGAVYVGDVYKLENSVAKYGGVDANGLLVSAFQAPGHIQKRINASPKLKCVSGADVVNVLQKLA